MSLFRDLNDRNINLTFMNKIFELFIKYLC